MFVDTVGLKAASALLVKIVVQNDENEEVTVYEKSINEWNDEDSLEELDDVFNDFRNLLSIQTEKPEWLETN